ncbi:glycoside hydrolase family 5 protein [Dactylosporangium sp. CA-233914]|uniref:glycoside hydrolase family 5 protein n=1 Tax=Dactylosporangium sp. CA-233914 TaxID=3239934 RepID=UPI003D8A86A2
MNVSIPRWRGFNLIDLFSTSVRWKDEFPMSDGLVPEEDFALIRELGFDFVRVPLSYLWFGKGAFGREVDQERLRLLDRVVEFGRQYGVHVMLGFHRAPGYCVTSSSYFDFPERGDLFRSDEDLVDFLEWWRALAERYQHVPAQELSFNLLNEPIDIDDATFDRTFLPAVEAIHKISPDRRIHVEGRFMLEDGTLDGGVRYEPPTKAVRTLPNIVSSVHMYSPLHLTHYDNPWAGSNAHLLPPQWPFTPTLRPGSTKPLVGEDTHPWDKAALRDTVAQYLDLADSGLAVHVGEIGAYTKISHDTFLGWLDDALAVFAEHGIGWALWNFRGPFGVLDSRRTDVNYEPWKGHQLDRKMLEILRAH